MENVTANEVDGLSKSVRESMLQTLLGMAQDEKNNVDVSQTKGTSTAVEI